MEGWWEGCFVQGLASFVLTEKLNIFERVIDELEQRSWVTSRSTNLGKLIVVRQWKFPRLLS